MLNFRKIFMGLVLPVLIVAIGFLFKNQLLDKNSTNNTLVPPNSDNVSPTIRFARVPPGGTAGILAIMRKNGFDKEFGFTLEEIDIAPNEAQLVLGTGRADVVDMSPIQAAKSNLEGNSFQIIAPALRMSCLFVVRKDSNVNKWTDLKGKNVGSLAPNTGTYQSALIALNQKGFELDDYFKMISVPYPSMLASVSEKKVDGIIGMCGDDANARVSMLSDYRIVNYLNDLYEGTLLEGRYIPLVMVTTSKSWAQGNHNLVIGLNKAIYKSFNHLLQNPQEFDQPDIAQAYGLPSKAELDYLKLNKDYFYGVPDWDSLIKNTNIYFNMATESGLLEKAPSEEIFTTID